MRQDDLYRTRYPTRLDRTAIMRQIDHRGRVIREAKHSVTLAKLWRMQIPHAVIIVLPSRDA